MNPNEFPIVFLRCLDEAPLGDAPGAEGCHEGGVLTAQYHYIRVRRVNAVVELRKEVLLWRSAFHGPLTPLTVRLEGLFGVSRLLAPITDSTKSFRSMPKRPICRRGPISGNGSSMTLPTSAQGPYRIETSCPGVVSLTSRPSSVVCSQRNISASCSKLKTGSASPVPSRSTVSTSSWPNPSFGSFAITQYLCVPTCRGTPPAVSVPFRVEAPSTRAALMHFLCFEGRVLFGSRLQPYIDHTPSSALKSTQIHSNTLNHVKSYARITYENIESDVVEGEGCACESRWIKIGRAHV